MKTHLTLKSIFLSSAVLIILLSACGPSSPATPTLDINIAYTQVAQTIAVDLTRSAPSATPLPPPATPTPIILPSSTPEEATATITVPPTPTVPPDDPRLILGEPTWEDPFNSEVNWTLFDSECFRNTIDNGTLELLGKGIGYVCWTITWPDIHNFYLEATVQTVDSCPANNYYGLFFRSPSNEQGYAFNVTCDGRYGLLSWDNQKATTIIKSTTSPQALAGPNQTNRLGVMVKDDSIELYINGVLQTEIQDATYSEAGKFGVAVYAAVNDPFAVLFDQIAYWELP